MGNKKISVIEKHVNELDLFNDESMKKLMFWANIEVYPVSNGKWQNKGIPIISHEYHFTMKQLNRVKKAFDNLMREIIKAKAENEKADSNSLVQMATFTEDGEYEEMDKELYNVLQRHLENQKELENRETIKLEKKKKGIFRRFIK